MICKSCEVGVTMHKAGWLYQAFIYHEDCAKKNCDCTHKGNEQ